MHRRFFMQALSLLILIFSFQARSYPQIDLTHYPMSKELKMEVKQYVNEINYSMKLDFLSDKIRLFPAPETYGRYLNEEKAILIRDNLHQDEKKFLNVFLHEYAHYIFASTMKRKDFFAKLDTQDKPFRMVQIRFLYDALNETFADIVSQKTLNMGHHIVDGSHNPIWYLRDINIKHKNNFLYLKNRDKHHKAHYLLHASAHDLSLFWDNHDSSQFLNHYLEISKLLLNTYYHKKIANFSKHSVNKVLTKLIKEYRVRSNIR